MDGKNQKTAYQPAAKGTLRPIIYGMTRDKSLFCMGLYQSARAGFADSSSGVAARSEGGMDVDCATKCPAAPTPLPVDTPSRCATTVPPSPVKNIKNNRHREANHSRGGSRGSTGGAASAAAVGNLRNIFIIPPPLPTARTTAIAVRMQQAEGIFATAPHAPFGVGCHVFSRASKI
jgi:hypothetical protein